MIREAIAALFRELLEQLQEARNDRIVKRRFGQYGEGAYVALYQIRENLRRLNKYGASVDLKLETDDNGKVDAEAVYSAVCRAINEHCPDMEEVWG